tara:strand:+ start:103 stop:261 length:159 start_codon:yes stop_codon:yes gene_type:complete
MKYTKIKSIECPPNREIIIKNDFKLFIIALCMFANWKVLFFIVFFIFYFLES